MTEERSNVSKMNREPVIVSLGGTDYKLHPKNLLELRKWKQKALPIINKIQDVIEVMGVASSETETIDMAEIFVKVKTFLFADMDDIIDLVFDWDETLPKDEILSTADEMEMLEAFKEVLSMSLPFLKTMGLNLSSLSLKDVLLNTAGAMTT